MCDLFVKFSKYKYLNWVTSRWSYADICWCACVRWWRAREDTELGNKFTEFIPVETCRRCPRCSTEARCSLDLGLRSVILRSYYPCLLAGSILIYWYVALSMLVSAYWSSPGWSFIIGISPHLFNCLNHYNKYRWQEPIDIQLNRWWGHRPARDSSFVFSLTWRKISLTFSPSLTFDKKNSIT